MFDEPEYSAEFSLKEELRQLLSLAAWEAETYDDWMLVELRERLQLLLDVVE